MEEIKKENQGEKKEVQINDHCYRFEEMRDQMMQSLTNINRVLKQQRRLMTIVEEAIKDDEDKEKQPFEEFDIFDQYWLSVTHRTNTHRARIFLPTSTPHHRPAVTGFKSITHFHKILRLFLEQFYHLQQDR